MFIKVTNALKKVKASLNQSYTFTIRLKNKVMQIKDIKKKKIR